MGCGASAVELCGFELAAEEAAAHVIEGFPTPIPDDRFSVTCEDRDGGLEFNFADRRVVINPDKTCQDDLMDIDSYPDKRRLHLIRNVCDSLELRNRGNDGWSIVFFKTIRNFRAGQPEPLPDRSVSAVKEKIKVVSGTKEDIPALVELSYYVFRYSYLEYFTPDYFAAMMDNPYHVFHVAKTESGRVVAFQNYAVEPEMTTEICYYYDIMTHPYYRNSLVMLKFAKKIAVDLNNPPHPDVRLWFLELIATHIHSQRYAADFDFTICGIKPSHDVVVQYTGDIESIDQRETYLLAWHWLVKYHGGIIRFYSVPEHADIIRRIFSLQEMNGQICTAEFVSAAEFHVTVKVEAGDGTLTITFEHFAADENAFALLLRHKKEEAMDTGLKTVYVRIPAWVPLPEYISAGMKGNGFFFTGIEPRNASEIYILYCCLCAQNFDFDKVKVCDPYSLELLSYVKNEYMMVN
ncbi:MAG: hypothetical protein A4E71_00012 [Smithella sp. PtaU1.Bin162]|nr:MAG: hypothetical protein A4E71_00012 [Smithella sp. PtaU1.Bin162]